MGKQKTWSTTDFVTNWVGPLDIGQMRLDMAKWQPEKNTKVLMFFIPKSLFIQIILNLSHCF